MSDDDTNKIDTLTQCIRNLHVQPQETERELREIRDKQATKQACGRRRKGAPQT